MTFMNDACRAANLPPLLFSDMLPDAMKSLWPAFQKAFRSDIRGTRLNDILAFGDSGRLKITHPSRRLTGKFAEQKAHFSTVITALTGVRQSGMIFTL
jgi:hypothetical protein